MEIERKFLIKDISMLNLFKYNRKCITQDYLYSDGESIIRKRKIETKDNIKYTYTVKTGKQGISVNEYEKEIDESIYNALLINPKYNTIKKTRYIIPYNQHKIELDIFDGIYEGIMFAEIEFASEEDANEFIIPNWFYREISESITNADMAMNNMYEKLKQLMK